MSDMQHRMPDERESHVHHFELVTAQDGIINVKLICGLQEDGTLGEITIMAGKPGTTLHGLCKSLGIMIAIALQYGAPVESIADKLMYTNTPPFGCVMHPEPGSPLNYTRIALLDYIGRYLNATYAPCVPHTDT